MAPAGIDFQIIILTLKRNNRLCPLLCEENNDFSVGGGPGSGGSLPSHPLIFDYRFCRAKDIIDKKYMRPSAGNFFRCQKSVSVFSG
jgi:hypothetical protein